MDTAQKIEGLKQLSDDYFYKPRASPIVLETAKKVNDIVNKLFRSGNIDTMTHKWLKIGLKKPRIPEFYTLTKIHKKIPIDRPIVSGSSGPRKRISSFVDSLSVISMADLEKRLLQASPIQPFLWKRFIDNIFSVEVKGRKFFFFFFFERKEVTDFVNFANSFHPTIKFTCERSSDRTVFLDTEVFKGPLLTTLKTLDIRLNAFNLLFDPHLNYHVPIKKVKLRSRPNPCVTDEIRSLMSTRDYWRTT